MYSQWDMIIPNIWKIQMFQTTNQYIHYIIIYYIILYYIILYYIILHYIILYYIILYYIIYINQVQYVPNNDLTLKYNNMVGYSCFHLYPMIFIKSIILYPIVATRLILVIHNNIYLVAHPT